MSQNLPKSIKLSVLLSLIWQNPSYGLDQILAKLPKIEGKKIFSRSGIHKTLTQLGLNSVKKRRAWAKRIATAEAVEEFAQIVARKTRKKLAPEERLEMIRLVDQGEMPVSRAAQAYGVSRKNFYKWKKRYQASVPGKEYRAVCDQKPIIEQRWNQLTDKQVEAILKVVRQHPEYSTHKVSQRLAEVGNHGVQNVFQRLNLNTYEKRLAYAQACRPVVTPATRMVQEIKTIFGKIPVVSAIPPPKAEAFRRARQKFYYLAGQAGPPFIFSLLFSTTFSTILIYWLRILSQAPTLGAKLGLFFASVSLLVGGFFFAYSMKYYFTLALVLSFSRQPLGEGGGYVVGLNGRLNGRLSNNNQRNNNGGSWLQRIFGVGLTSSEVTRDKREEVVQAGGLQPSLGHIKLKRYPFVSIHLPFYNEKKVAERILKACTSMDYPNFEIIVCDDSTDKTTKITRMFADKFNTENPNGPKIKVLHRPTRKGFKGGALSYALKHMDPRTEFVVVFDADFIPYPDTLELFIKYFKANNDNSENYQKGNIAVVGGYQWHVLNKSENWITRGVRTEYAGSYVIERPGREILGLLKQISGAVYMIRADVLKKVGWGTSITEDFQLTLRLYAQGYKVIYTPYVQAPAECVSTLKRLIRQRMRWAEGHSNNIRKMFPRLIFSPKLSFSEKLELLYLSPYYLQAAFFMVGTFSWLLAETVFRARLPFWTSLWGWSLVLTNFLSLPLVNTVGLFLEESEQKDYVGLLSFIALSYILVPFQAYASIKGFLEKEEGPWFRTPKTGKITDIFTRGRFYRWVSGIVPGRRLAPALARSSHRPRSPIRQTQGHLGGGTSLNPYLALVTANNRFNSFQIRPRRLRWVGRTLLVFILSMSLILHSMAFRAQPVESNWLSGWDNRIKITIDSSVVDGSLLRFPVMVYLSSSSGSGGDDVTAIFDEVGANSKKIAVTKDDATTQLYVEIERWDSSAEKAWLWVSLDGWSIPSSPDTELYIYYDNSQPDNTAYVGDVAARTEVWNDDFKMAQHMGGASYTALDDSTSNNHDVTVEGGDPTYQQSGRVDYAVEFDGAGDYVSVPDSADWYFGTGTFTIEFAIRYNALPTKGGATNGFIIWDQIETEDEDGQVIQVWVWDGSDQEIKFTYMSKVSNVIEVWYEREITPVVNTWYHYALVRGQPYGSDEWIHLVIDGVPLSGGYISTKNVGDYSAPMRIGGNSIGLYAINGFFNGKLDEVRVSKDAGRDTPWVKATYHTEKDTLIKDYVEELIPELVILLIPIALVMPVIIKYIRRKKELLVISN